MAKTIMMDEFHVTVFAPGGLRKAEYAGISRALNGARFRRDLGRAVRAVFRRHPSLRKVRVRLSC